MKSDLGLQHAQVATWSDYKHQNTLKNISWNCAFRLYNILSHCYGGMASDEYIVLDSGILDLLERDNHVIAERGFQIKEDLLLKFCNLPRPHAKSQFTEDEVKTTREVAKLRIHVERAINRMKTFRIIKSVLLITLLHNADDIMLSFVALCNSLIR